MGIEAKWKSRGIRVGKLPCGPLDKISDVPGVTVGHCTLADGEVQTGVTALLPHQGDIFHDKVMAASHVINGFGKTTGLVQIDELGTLETPILFTNTLSVGTVETALVKYMLDRNPVIVVLVLVCVSPLVQNLARWLMRLLPKTEKWQQRRADWQQQLDVLGEESRRLLADKPRCAEILALQAVKLFGLFCLPYLCIRFMGLSPLSFLQVQLLTSLMLFLSNALPNVAGMGSIETAFLLVFGSFLKRGEVMSVMMLYRIASYYVVFAASAVGFFFAQRHLGQMGAELPKEA